MRNYKAICLTVLLLVNIFIGVNFYKEYLTQLNYTFNADGLRLIVFMLPLYFVLITLLGFSIYKKESKCTVVCFINGLLQVLAFMDKPKHIPINVCFISILLIVILFFLMIIEVYNKKN